MASLLALMAFRKILRGLHNVSAMAYNNHKRGLSLDMSHLTVGVLAVAAENSAVFRLYLCHTLSILFLIS